MVLSSSRILKKYLEDSGVQKIACGGLLHQQIQSQSYNIHSSTTQQITPPRGRGYDPSFAETAIIIMNPAVKPLQIFQNLYYNVG